MNAQSLAAVVELQKSIRVGHLDAEGAMYLITDWARGVANASGVAIGRLNGHQLVYAAGSGSAAPFVGRRVIATFSPSAPNPTRAEILRVENTGADTRIEAAICRQLGVKSLLILPVYKGLAMAGVLQVLFNEAHSFLDQEVRIYRLLASLVGDAMSQTVQLEHKKAAPAKRPGMQPGIADITPATRELSNRGAPLPRINKGAVCQVCGASIPEPLRLPAIERLRQTARAAWPRTKQAPVYRLAALAAVAVLVATPWIRQANRPRAILPLAVPAPQKSNASELPQPLAPPPRAASGNASAVPVRYFAPAILKPASGLHGRVKHFGDDVTVRYFSPEPAVMRAAPDSEVHRLSEDVTVRYFRPRNVGTKSKPVGSEVSQQLNR
ncbi:MAG: GAF domain-containing protein [Terriglobales bacterium]